MSAKQIQSTIEAISRLIRSEARFSGEGQAMQPVQLEALHYLSICNRYSNTPQAVVDFLGATKGTISQTLKALENKGLLRRKQDLSDKRVVHLYVSEAGRELLKKAVPAKLIARAWDHLVENDRRGLAAQLEKMLGAMQKLNGMKSFGVCKTCVHNRPVNERQFFCELTRETLTHEDVEQICREHTSRTAESAP